MEAKSGGKHGNFGYWFVLFRLGYSECALKIQDKITCSRFLNAVSHPFIRQTLQVEGVKSLKEAVVRALEIKDIQENNIFHFLHNQVKSDRNVQLERFSRKSSSGRDGEKDCRDKSFWNSNESKWKWQKETWKWGGYPGMRSDSVGRTRRGIISSWNV